MRATGASRAEMGSIRHFFGFAAVFALPKKAVLGRNLNELLVFYRKFDDESTSVRPVVVHTDEPMMVGYDTRHDRQS